MIADELKQQIISRAGLERITARDCSALALDIHKVLNKSISVTTLKRAFGFIKSTHHLSKYTIATLSDYVIHPTTISNCTEYDVIHSFILQQGIFLFELNDEVGLHPQRMVLDALDILLKKDYEYLPVIIAGKCIGIVYVKDLIRFLASDDEMYGTLYHKFNFSLQSAIGLLQDSRKF